MNHDIVVPLSSVKFLTLHYSNNVFHFSHDVYSNKYLKKILEYLKYMELFKKIPFLKLKIYP